MTGYEALRTDAAWFDVSDRGKIRVTGEDRARLLHAMSTNHVQGLAPNSGLYTFFLNAQGRILADAYVFNLGDWILLETEPELRPKILEHLDKFIIADDVTLEDESEQWAAYGLEGPNSLARAAELGIPVPDAANGVATWDNCYVLRAAVTGGDGLRLLVPVSSRGDLMARFAKASFPEASAAEVRTVRLEQATPRYGEDITERFLVQESGVLRAVHFNKGCYLGQEIVERVRSRAQIHRHLKPLRIATTVELTAGTKLVKDGQPAGEITSCVFSPAWNALAGLGYVRTEASEANTKLTVADADPPITVEVR